MKTEVQVVYDNLNSVRRLLNMPFEKSMNKYKEFANVNISFVEINRIDDALRLLKEQQERIETLEIERDILARDISTNNCNTCKRKCEHRPRLGEVVRVNCFMWDDRKNDD